jgi:hypothetical protein
MTAEEGATGPRIVVGVDGSPSSQAAFRWAIRQAPAHRRGSLGGDRLAPPGGLWVPGADLAAQ